MHLEKSITSRAIVISNQASKEIIDKQIILHPKKIIVSQTDDKGRIIYVNKYFTEIAGYTESEVLGKPHNIIRHPDMPKAVFYLMWDRIQNGQNITALVKNLAKSGKYYWVMTDFEIKKDPRTGIITYIAYRRAPSDKAVASIEPIYQTLLEMEKIHGMEASIAHLQSFLEVRHTTYDKFIDRIIKQEDGIFRLFFNKFKRAFN